MEKAMINMPSAMMGPLMFQMTLLKMWMDPFGLMTKEQPPEEAKSAGLGFDAFSRMNPFLALPGVKEMQKVWLGVYEQSRLENQAMSALYANPFVKMYVDMFKAFTPA
jgi:hypothetical protein